MAEAVMAVALVVAAVTYKYRGLINRFYYVNFEQIYLGLYGVAAALFALIAYRVAKNTEASAKRVRFVRSFSRTPGIFIGRTTDGIPLRVPERSRLGHVQIIGATGRGKTESVILPWLLRDLALGRSAILMDGKGDPNLAAHVSQFIRERIQRVRLVTFDLGNPGSSCKINPLKFGTPQQITDRLFTAFSFDQSYYKSVQYSLAGSVISLIADEVKRSGDGKEVTFARIYELLTDDGALGKAVAEAPSGPTKVALTKHLAESKKEREQKFSGLVSQLAPFAVGEIAPLVNGCGGHAEDENGAASEEEAGKTVTLSEVVLGKQDDDGGARSNPPVVLILLIPTLLYQEIGAQLGKFLLQELAWAVGERASRFGEDGEFLPVYLDEFSAFVYPQFGHLLNKARSSGVALHLSHQSLGDLEAVSPEFAKVVNTNSNVKCLLGLNDPETADFFARHLGTETEEKLTHRAVEEGGILFRNHAKTGEMSMREVEAYKIHPNRLKSYSSGRGVIHLPTPNGNLTEEIQFARYGEGREG
ncbi:MAG: type IV secretory system conjugative DNA transfer family protein [Bdellovibrionota bacterium]